MASGSESPSESQLYVHDDDTESTASAPATSSAEPASTTDSHSLCSAGDPGSSSDRRQRGRGRGGRGTGRFKRSWKLPPYIAGSKRGTKYAYCKLCSSNFDISHGGFNDIKRHVEGVRHTQRLSQSSSSSPITDFYGMSAVTQSHSRNVISAELMMCQFIALHNLPFLAADHLSDLLPAMFPDSKIARDFACKRTKTKSMICGAIDPYLKDPIVSSVRIYPFNLLCDESNERGDSVKLLTVLVRFFDQATGTIATRHLDTIGITDCSAQGIFDGLMKTLNHYQIPSANLLSFTSDTCNVMKGARNGVIAKLRELQPCVIDISCMCHSLNLCVKSAVKSLPLKVDDLLVDIFYHFHHSVKWVSSLQEYADFCNCEYKTVLKHCETRWLSLRKAVIRTLQMWQSLVSYFSSHPDVEKSGKVKSISKLLNDPMTKPWLSFLSNILGIFDKFNILFQTTSTPLVHRVHGEMSRLLRKVLSFFVSSNSLLSHGDDLTSVDYVISRNHLTHDRIFVGDDTTALLLHLQDEGHEIDSFYGKVVSFYVSFIKKLLKVHNFRSLLWHSFSFLDPPQSQQISDGVFDDIERVMPISFNKEQVKLEAREFSVDPDIGTIPKDDAVRFWLHVKSMESPLGEKKYHHLSDLSLNLLSVPASNADSERVFSLVRRIKTDFRASLATETVSALIGCHLNTTFECCEKRKFDVALLNRAQVCTSEINKKQTV